MQQISSSRTFSKGLVKKGLIWLQGRDTWWKVMRLHVKPKEILENPKKSKVPGGKANRTLTKPKTDTKLKGATETKRERGRNSERNKKIRETEI